MKSFSIYLLKAGFDQSNCFKDGADLDAPLTTDALPDGAHLYVFDNPPKPPWWRRYFDIEIELNQVLKGAILILPVEDRHFCLTFGHVAHNILDTSYEYDFGMQVTLNCLDPSKIKNTDTLIPATSMRQRTQVSSDTDLANFDFDRNSTIVKSLTGKVREEYKDIIKSATGASHLRVGTDSVSEELPDLCAQMLELYTSDAYKDHFSDIRNIVPIRDPMVIETLNQRLIDAIRGDQHVGLTIPEIVDYQDAVLVRFKGAGGSRDVCDDIQFIEYTNYLGARGVDKQAIDVGLLKKHGMYLCDEDGVQKGKVFSLFKSLVFDTEIVGDAATYHLSEGGWYRVDGDFVNRLTEYLDPLFRDQQLPDYTGGGEGAYNDVASDYDLRICLDRTNISPQSQRAVEPCDIAQLENGEISLIHVKISTQSSLLSHLFNQGINSFDLLRSNAEARARLRQLISDGCEPEAANDWGAALDAERLSVRYAIVTHKNAETKSKSLPLFSRISLYRVMQGLQTRGISHSIELVRDNS